MPNPLAPVRRVLISALLFVGAVSFATSASAEEKLCDASATNCRVPLISLIDNETQGIDVGVWFFKDSRYVTALINAKNRGVPIRIIMDPRANAQYSENGPLLDKLSAAGIPMRKRIAGDICHWKLMIFAGQGVVEWSGANFSPTAFVPQDPYSDYEDEVIYFSEQLVPSFMTMFDNIWTNTKEYANYANVPPTLVRNYPTTAVDARLNFPPKDSYQDRLIPLIDREPAGGWIDVDMYRITLARPVDALIRAASRGIRIRMYLEPNEYTNTARPGNKVQMDRLVAAAQQYPGTIEIRMRKHLGLNHQKTIWLHTQHVVVFGTSNWSDASDDNQLEANIFTDKVGGDPLNEFLFTELGKVFERKWNNRAPDGSIETVAWRTPTLPPPSEPTTCGDPNATNFGGPLPCTYPPPPPPPPPGAKTIVVYPAKGTITGANWQVASDATAAAGKALWNPNADKPKVAPALASPASYVERTFDAMTGTAYHVWVRMRAQDDSFSNDSLYIQFSDSVTQSGAATQRIGTSSSAEFLLQDGPGGSGNSGWGWADNGWGVAGALVYFAATGTHTLRIQAREDGPYIDQIVLSPDTYISNPPGPRNGDSTILPEGGASATCDDPKATNFGGPAPCKYPPPPDTSTVVLYPAKGTVHGNWQLLNDATAAAGKAVWNPNANQAKVSPALTAPANYVDATFDAKSATAYHVWIRMRSEGDSFGNDSVHLQFSDSVTSGGAATQRISTTSSAEFVLQNGSTGPALHSWGWTDNGWGAPGDPIYFAATGTHTVRIQQREDGAIVDQVVLSPVAYFTNPPGPRSNDTTILPETGTSSPPPACTFTLSSSGKSYGSGTGSDSFTVTASDGSCTWTAASNANWVTITGGTPGTGTGTVDFSLAANTGAARSATITAAGKTFTVSQTAGSTSTCTVTLSPTNASYAAAGGSGSFTVTASDPSCTWTAASTATSWLSVDSGSASGTGNGTVSYTVAANTGAARSGAINVGGQAFAATQDAGTTGGGSSCGTVTLDATSKTVGGAEANWIITVTAPSTTCTWTATSDASWLVVKSTTPTAMPVAGSGTVKVRAIANTTGASRTGHFTINGVVYTVKQLAG